MPSDFGGVKMVHQHGKSSLSQIWRDKLASELQELNSAFDKALQRSRSADADELDHLMPALAAAQGIAFLVKHLQVLPELQDGKKTEYLQTIAMDLKNLADGMPTQFIRPFGLKNAPASPHQHFYIQAHVVLTTEVMVAAGYRSAEAYRLVAKELNNSGIPTPRKANQHGWAVSTLDRWRTNFGNTPSDLPWVTWARRELDKFRSDPNWPPSPRDADDYLGRLADRIRQKISIPPRPMR